MRAVIQSGYGNAEAALSVQEVPIPTPGDDEILVRVRAASMHADIWHAITGLPYVLRLFGMGIRKPKCPVPGTDLAGVVEAVGKDVTRFRPGDEVFGESHIGLQTKNGGAYAEYAVVPERVLACKPQNVSFEQAASVPASGVVTWLNMLAFGDMRAGRTMLSNGAAGGVGSLALQIAKARGIVVTGVDNTEKIAMLRELGADRTIDYTKQNVMATQERYDFILDVATTLPYPRVRDLLSPAGLYQMVGHSDYGAVGGKLFGGLPKFLKFLFVSPFDKHLPSYGFEMPERKDIMMGLKKLLEEEKITPLVGKSFSLDEVPLALQCLKQGRARGKIVITP